MHMTLQLLDLYIQYIFISCSKVEWEIDRQIDKASAAHPRWEGEELCH